MSTRFGPKHQRKVNECYPVNTGESGAAGGKISALTYYINAKPAKLLKVSAYLERKVQRDLARESAQYAPLLGAASGRTPIRVLTDGRPSTGTTA